MCCYLPPNLLGCLCFSEVSTGLLEDKLCPSLFYAVLSQLPASCMHTAAVAYASIFVLRLWLDARHCGRCCLCPCQEAPPQCFFRISLAFSGCRLVQATVTDLVVQLDRSITTWKTLTCNCYRLMLQQSGWLLSPAHVSHVCVPCRCTRARMAMALRLQWQGCHWLSTGRSALAC